MSLVIDTPLQLPTEWFAAADHDSGTLSTDASMTSSRSQLIGTEACAKVLRSAAQLVIELDAAGVVE